MRRKETLAERAARRRKAREEQKERQRVRQELQEAGKSPVPVDQLYQEPAVWFRPPKKPPPNKKFRVKKLTISLSTEELKIIQQFCKERGIPRSEWARLVLFQAMGIPLPPRPS